MRMGRGGKRKGAGRPPAWKHSKTQAIRVPERFVVQLLEIARRLDEGESIEVVSKGLPSSDDGQLLLFSDQIEDFSTGLGLTKLADRLSVSSGTLHRRQLREDLTEWTRQKDPEGISWKFHPELRKFFPIEQPNKIGSA